MTLRQLRALRGAGASATAVVLAAVSHTIGGGAAPAMPVLLAVAALSWPAATGLVGRRLSPAGMVCAVLLAQLGLHVAFASTGGSDPQHGAGERHVHDSLGWGVVLPALSEGSAPDAGMLGSHLVAAAAAILLLVHGERALRGIARWVLRSPRRSCATAPPPRVVQVRSPYAPHLAARRAPQLAPQTRRGPPALSGDVRVA